MKKSTHPVIAWLGSFGLCTTILAFLFLLTLLGTIESARSGLFVAQERYFESFYLIQHLGPLAIPLPGALSLMILLACNLFVGGFVRMRKSQRTVGILIVHSGIALLLLAGLVKMWGASEGHVTLYEGQRASNFVSFGLWEVAVVDVQGDPKSNEWVVGNEVVRSLEDGEIRILQGDGLPFDVQLQHFIPNANVLQKGPMWITDYPVIDGYAVRSLGLNPEEGGNFAAVFATVVPKGSPKGTSGMQGILWAGSRAPFVANWEGRPYTINIRRERYPLPFDVQMVKFTKEEHPRTNIASKFASDVLRVDGDSQTPVHISMNEPLRENGLVMFQSSWGPSNARPGDPLFSTFAVVRNPSDKWPEYACWVIAVGMLIAFGQRLLAYLSKQSKQRIIEQEKSQS